MKGLTALLAGLAMVALMPCSSAQATILVFTADLDASQVVAGSSSLATGSAIVTIDTDAFTITTDETWGDVVPLSGLVDRSHMHSAPAGQSTDDLFFHEVLDSTDSPLGDRSVPCAPWVPDSGFTNCAPADGSLHDVLDATDGHGYPGGFSALLGVFLADGVYIDIHTELYPLGEIRGQLLAPATVPEPASLGLMGLGLAALVALRQRR
jgi:hypothetical protein